MFGAGEASPVATVMASITAADTESQLVGHQDSDSLLAPLVLENEEKSMLLVVCPQA